MVKSRTCLFILLLLCLSVAMGLAQWTMVNNPVGIYTRVEYFAGAGSKLYLGTFNGGVWTTGDFANTEPVRANTGLSDTSIRGMAVIGSNVFVGTGSGVFISSNNGASWSSANNGLVSTNVFAFTVKGTKLFAGTAAGVFVSTDNGANWDTAYNGMLNYFSNHLTNDGTNLYAGTSTGVYVSTDDGANWTSSNSGLTNVNIYDLLAAGSNIYAVIPTANPSVVNVFVSADNGGSWNPANTGFPNTSFSYMAAVGSNVFAGTYGSGFYLTTDGGAHWNPVNTGYGSVPVRNLYPFGGYLFAASFDGGVWRRRLSDMITSVKEVFSTETPKTFSLQQNYPNPFNPSTTIRYSIPANAFVNITVYNLLGEKVDQLVSGGQLAGEYEATWDASRQASGVYYVRMTTAGDVSGELYQGTKKIALIK